MNPTPQKLPERQNKRPPYVGTFRDLGTQKKTLRASRIRQQTLKVFAFKTILKGSSFCSFGRVMYKTKTPVKFVDNRKS